MPTDIHPLHAWPMELKQYPMDAIADHVFSGNPAGVVPVAEVDLCGHATLAAAHALFCHEGINGDVLSFHTRSGELLVKRDRDSLEMSLPIRRPVACATPEILVEAFGIEPIETLAADDYIAVYDSEAVIRSTAPNMDLLRRLDLRGIMITAPGNDVDFVSRFFAPKLGVPEDPVTGSAHCALAPYWSERLGRTRLQAFQCSKRGGHITCTLEGERVILSGRAFTFMEGTISIV